MKKILITSVSAGAGHVRAANAVEEYLKDKYSVRNEDLMEHSQIWFKNLYADKYLDLVNHTPWLWKLLYSLSDKPTLKTTFKLRRWIEYKTHHKFFKYIEQFQPEIIISTHFMPPEILLRLKEKTNLQFKIFVVVTDFDVHYLWTHIEADHYFVAGQLAKDKLIKYGITSDKITISGIPIMPLFFYQYTVEEKQQLHHQWKTHNNKIKVLLMAGGAGIGDLDVIAKDILSKRENIQLIVLAGKNKELLEKLQSLEKQYPANIIAMGFTNKVHELMNISDIVMTKPGGLSTSECIAMKKPMLLVNPIPGQEEHNAIYLESLGIAKLAKNINDDLNFVINNLPNFINAYTSDVLKPLDTNKIINDTIMKFI